MVFESADLAMPTKPVPKKRGRKKKPKKWSKPEGMPKRPLSAYNIFFATERQRLLDQQRPAQAASPEPKEKGGIGFASLARTVASKWRSSTPAEKKPFFDEAAREQARYKAAVKEWQDQGLDPRMSKKAVTTAPSSDTTPLVDIRQFNEVIPTIASLYRQTTLPDLRTTLREETGLLDVSTQSLPATHFDGLLDEASARSSQIVAEPIPFAFNTFKSQRMEPEVDLEPLPIDYKLGRKEFGGLVQTDYRALSARLFCELNSTLDDYQIGLLKATFARSA